MTGTLIYLACMRCHQPLSGTWFSRLLPKPDPRANGREYVVCDPCREAVDRGEPLFLEPPPPDPQKTLEVFAGAEP